MAKYLQRSCPRCNGYLGIVVPERKAKVSVQAINGRCVKCGYRLAWIVVQKKHRSCYSLHLLPLVSSSRRQLNQICYFFCSKVATVLDLSLIHISEPTRLLSISYAV